MNILNFFKSKSLVEAQHKHDFHCVRESIVPEQDKTFGYEIMPCRGKCRFVTFCMPMAFQNAPEEHKKLVLEALNRDGWLVWHPATKRPQN